MIMTASIVIVSHSKDIAQGVYTLLQEVAGDVDIQFVGGTEDGGIGTSFDRVQAVVDAAVGDVILAFYDLGSAKMNLEMVSDFSDKEIRIFDVAFVEGAYTAGALLQAGASLDDVVAQVEELRVSK